MKKKLKINKLRDKAWRCLSKYIRTKGRVPGGWNQCVTCKGVYHWRDLQAGHFIHGHSKPTFMVEENVHPQCVSCNHFHSGSLLEYYDFMIERYGHAKIGELRRLSKTVVKFPRSYYEELIEKYTNLTKGIK